MSDTNESEGLEGGDLDPEQWNEYAIEQDWSDGMPLFAPTEDKVGRFVEICRGDNEPFSPMPPRRVIPTLESIAANAVMAGCRPEYFPVVVAAVRALLNPEYNLHGTLATTHPCAPGIILSAQSERKGTSIAEATVSAKAVAPTQLSVGRFSSPC